MRGRIIGHEGKNIKAFEQVTGIQISSTSRGIVAAFGFNPVKREIARRVLEMLLKDGNIHPRRIEELTRRTQRKLDEEMKKAGEQTLKEMASRTSSRRWSSCSGDCSTEPPTDRTCSCIRRKSAI
jgi:ribonuclease Y